jgi:predicted GH43/DUF377 family glycosyl hydrolase
MYQLLYKKNRHFFHVMLLTMVIFAFQSCRFPEITDKPYLGFTPLSYDLPTQPGVEPITYGFLAYHGTLITHHLDDGIPWQESFTGMPFPDSLEHDIQTRLNNTNATQKIYLAITPLAKFRNELAANWGERPNEPRTGEWADRDFDSPEVKIAYLNYCRRMIRRFNPDYFAYAIEANLWPIEDPAGFMKMATLLAEIYFALKSEFPDLPIFLSLAVEDDEKFNKRLHYTTGLLNISDYVAVSTYPFAQQSVLGVAANIKSNWFQKIIDLALDKPFAIAETSYLAEDLVFPHVTIPSDVHEQWDYLEFVLREAVQNNAVFVTWFVPIDYDRLWDKIGTPEEEWARTWRDTGLVSENFMPRPALKVWDSYLFGVGDTSWFLNFNALFKRWESHGGQHPAIIWNDPSVMRVGNEFWMWLSGGFSREGVRIFRFASTDGVEWTIANGGNPVLVPGDRVAGDFDWLGVETPVVIKAGEIFHMYYSAHKNGEFPFLTMGHAVSLDGDNWQKLGQLPDITDVVKNPAGNPWGWLSRGEPAAAYLDGTFLLYFTDVKCRTADCTGYPVPIRGISLAVSSDGHNFQQVGPQPVLLPDENVYLSSHGWEGFTTPWVVPVDGKLELYVANYRTIDGQSVHRGISRFASSDGINFETVSHHIVLPTENRWSSWQIRAPSVVENDGTLYLWFAADDMEAGVTDPYNAVTGIGLATLPPQ